MDSFAVGAQGYDLSYGGSMALDGHERDDEHSRLLRTEGEDIDVEVEQEGKLYWDMNGNHVDLESVIETNRYLLGAKEPSTIHVKNLSYTMRLRKADGKKTVGSWFRPLRKQVKEHMQKIDKSIINDVSFHIKPGTMTLILGAPGCGKTSLIRVLAGQMAGGTTEGSLTFNGESPDPKTYHRRVAYVHQDEIHLAALTVGETLMFAAHSQMGAEHTDEQIEYRVKNVLTLLGIDHREGTLVGSNLLRGVSGGEKRRVSIGIEMVKGCDVMLMDEPTTGLDASTSLDIFKSMKTVAAIACPVVAALQQPGHELFEQFDNVLMLSRGRCIYFGPREQVLPFFEAQGYVRPPTRNPADWLLDVAEMPHRVSGGEGGAAESGVSTQGGDEHTRHLEEIYKSSEIYDDVQRELNNSDEGKIPEKDPKDMEVYTASPWKQFYLNLFRGFALIKNYPKSFVIRVVRSIIVALVVGTAFFQMPHNQDFISARAGVAFFVITFAGVGALANTAAAFELRPVFYYQRANKYFSPLPYFLAMAVVDIPMTAIEGISFGTVIYWLSGLFPDVVRFIYFLLIVILISLSMNAFCRAGAFLFVDLLSALSVAPILMSILIMFSGFALKRTEIPNYYIWLYWGSVFQYANQGLSINEFIDATFYCTKEQKYPSQDDDDVDEAWPEGYNKQRKCPIQTGEQFLNLQDFEDKVYYKWIFLAACVGFFFAFSILSFLVIKFWAHSGPAKRNMDLDDPGDVEEDKELLAMATRTFTDKKGEVTYLEFKNVRYSVFIEEGMLCKKTKRELMLLKGISGYVRPGMLIALMGPSGAGKSTLLDVLANRKTGGKTEGDILFNGQARDEYFHRFSGYVEQQNLHVLQSTVLEAAEFSSFLRLGDDVPLEEKRAKARWALEQVKLTDVKNVILEQCSFEELKRLTIAVELAADPPLLFLDEPTSGLDSIAANTVMEAVKGVAAMGKAVICTIHQPSEPIFSFFSHLLLLKKGGETVFFGAIGENYSDLFDYFRTSFGAECPASKNPADFILDVCTSHDDSAEIYNKSDLSQSVQDKLDEGICPDDVKPFTYDRFYAATFMTQMKEVLKRGCLSVWRRPDQVKGTIARQIFLGVILGLFYQRLDDTQIGISNTASACYFAVLFTGLGAMGMIPVIINDRAAFYREQAAGCYRTIVYTFTIIISSLPHNLIGLFCFAIPYYFIAGFRLDSHGAYFFFFCLTYGGVVLVSMGLAQACAVLAPTMEVASALSGTMTTLSTTFGGFLLKRKNIPPYWIWMYWISYVRYALEALFVSQVRDRNFRCADDEVFPIVTNPASDGGTCVAAVPPACIWVAGYDDDEGVFINEDTCIPAAGTCFIKGYCHLTTGSKVIESYDMYEDLMWPDVLILYSMYSFYVFLIWFGLTYVKNIDR